MITHTLQNDMKVILVRHGETDENVAHRHQPETTPLSLHGRKQAVSAGSVLAELYPSHVVSSPLVRALQTAGLVANQCDLIPSIDYNLKELERPRTMTGHRHFSFRSLLFYKLWFFGWSQGGESYKELRARIAMVRDHIEQLPEDSVVVVVSHTVFINLFLAHVDRSHALWPWQAAWVFYKLVRMKNTAMRELSFADGEWSRTNDLNLK